MKASCIRRRKQRESGYLPAGVDVDIPAKQCILRIFEVITSRTQADTSARGQTSFTVNKGEDISPTMEQVSQDLASGVASLYLPAHSINRAQTVEA